MKLIFGVPLQHVNYGVEPWTKHSVRWSRLIQSGNHRFVIGVICLRSCDAANNPGARGQFIFLRKEGVLSSLLV